MASGPESSRPFVPVPFFGDDEQFHGGEVVKVTGIATTFWTHGTQ